MPAGHWAERLAPGDLQQLNPMVPSWAGGGGHVGMGTPQEEDVQSVS
jgi:hypothetical protein